MRFLTIVLLFLFGTSALHAQEILTIAEARQQPLGTQVTVTGWVTVTAEFRGPIHFQDETGGIAWYNGPLMRTGTQFNLNVAHGDSIVVTGTLGEFQPTPGQPGTGLLQLVSDTSYEIIPEGNKEIEPTLITISELNTNNFESMLIEIADVTIDHTGVLQSNTTYTIQDATASGALYINPRSEVPGTIVPDAPENFVGIASIFRGTNQLVPRTPEDLNAEPFTIPGEDIPKSETFDIVTWNIQWFGSTSNGPNNTTLQFNNVVEVIQTIDADLYAFQEISNPQTFQNLIQALDGYSGLLAPYTQTQRTAWLWKDETINVLNSGLLSTGQNSGDWAGRLPFWLFFDVTIGNDSREIHAYNIHAKAFTDATSYQQRVNSSNQIKTFLDNNRANANVIFMGDYNDRLTTSTRSGFPSPYQNFMEDDNYFPVSLSLEEAGFTSFRSSSMIDHIIVTNQLIEDHFDGTQRVDEVEFINNFESTTSDHYPVWTRFYLAGTVSVDEDEFDLPTSVTLDQNYPNPFNPSTNISFSIPQNNTVSLTVYDITGRRVAQLLNNDSRSAGSHTVRFDASGLATGVYLYRLDVNGSQSVTQKMLFVK